MPGRPSRRDGRAVAIAVVVGLALLVGCSAEGKPSSPSSPTPTTPTETPSDAPVTLKLEVYGDETTVGTYRAIASAFKAEHSNVTIKIRSLPEAGAAAEKAIGEISGGNDAPDLFLLDLDRLPDAVAADVLQPVNELLEARDVPFGDGVQRTALTAYSVDNTLACMPNDVSPYVLYYNKRLVKPRRLMDPEKPLQATSAWPWEMVLQAAAQAAAKGARGLYIPPDLRLVQAFLVAGDGTAVDDPRAPTTLTLGNEASRDALKTLATLTRDPLVRITPQEADRVSPEKRFAAGKTGMLIGTRALVPTLREVRSLNFGVAPLPSLVQDANVSEMNAYCIAKSSEHAETAADFIAFATVGDGADIAARSGAMVPADLDTLHSDAFLQPDQEPASAEVFTEAARKAIPTPYSPYWLEAASSATTALTRVLYGASLDVTSDETPALDALLKSVDEQSVPIFTPPEPSESPAS
ncbi:MAG: extracellular solute-binding protein [Nocardioidaceae bacterium]